MKSTRTKALAISPVVKNAVWRRDKICILCGNRAGQPNAHYIPRSQGGLGIEENIVTLCLECHRKLDQTTQRAELLKLVKKHLDLWYPDFENDNRYYKK